MRTTIDTAGRIVIPRALRERVGLTGRTDVDIDIDGAGIRLAPVTGQGLAEESGRLVIPPTGTPIDDDLVRQLRDADQR